MRKAARKVAMTAQHLIQRVREWCGDAAYERYQSAVLRRKMSPLTEEQFYLEQLERRYSRPSRCC
jgi:uncharacterized short protein YbdD (DUF466 family)